MSIDAKISLEKIVLFHGIEPQALKALEKLAITIETPAGETLLEESSQGSDVFAIISGRLDVSLMMLGGKTSDPIATLKEGEIFGESVLLGRSRRIAKVTAKDNSLSLRWGGRELQDYIKSHPDVGYVVMRNLASIIHERLTSTNMLLRNTLNRVVDIL